MTELIEAVKAGNINKIKELIEKGEDVHVTDKYGDTLCTIAYKQTINVDFVAWNTPSHRECKEKYQKIIDFLMEKGCNYTRNND